MFNVYFLYTLGIFYWQTYPSYPRNQGIRSIIVINVEFVCYVLVLGITRRRKLELVPPQGWTSLLSSLWKITEKLRGSGHQETSSADFFLALTDWTSVWKINWRNMTSIRHFICCCTTKKLKNRWRQKPVSQDFHASTVKGFELKMVKLTIWFVFSVFYWQYLKHYSYKYKLCS